MTTTKKLPRHTFIVKIAPGTFSLSRIRQLRSDLKLLLQGKAIAAKKGAEAGGKFHCKQTEKKNADGSSTTTTECSAEGHVSIGK